MLIATSSCRNQRCKNLIAPAFDYLMYATRASFPSGIKTASCAMVSIAT
jgi:hypothetical protein